MTTTPVPQWSGAENLPESQLLAWPLLSLTAALLAIFLFAWLAESVVEHDTAQFDSYIRAYVHQWASPPLTRLMFAITFMGSGGLIASALLAFALFRHFLWRGAAIWLLVTLGGALVLDLALKAAFHRPRPTPFFGNPAHLQLPQRTLALLLLLVRSLSRTPHRPSPLPFPSTPHLDPGRRLGLLDRPLPHLPRSPLPKRRTRRIPGRHNLGLHHARPRPPPHPPQNLILLKSPCFQFQQALF